MIGWWCRSSPTSSAATSWSSPIRAAGWRRSRPQDPRPWDKVLEFIGLPTKSTPGHLIKRVIGMPGDKVVCCTSKGRITVNGHALDETSYLYTDPDDDQINPSDVRFEVVVPKDRIFVMGDHRDLSADSRCHLSDLSTSQGKGQVAFVPTSIWWSGRLSRSRRRSTELAGCDGPPPSTRSPLRAILRPRER